MYLVDTSVWIDYIKGLDTPHTARLDALLENPLAVGINEHIYMEILQGANGQKAFDKFVEFFFWTTILLFIAARKKLRFSCSYLSKVSTKRTNSQVKYRLPDCPVRNRK